jgi:hypothetical protein
VVGEEIKKTGAGTPGRSGLFIAQRFENYKGEKKNSILQQTLSPVHSPGLFLPHSLTAALGIFPTQANGGHSSPFPPSETHILGHFPIYTCWVEHLFTAQRSIILERTGNLQLSPLYYLRLFPDDHSYQCLHELYSTRPCCPTIMLIIIYGTLVFILTMIGIYEK